MKITLAKSAGFCFGVKRAIEIAVKTAQSGQKVKMLNDIVHNEDVVKKISLLGIKKIKNLSKGKNNTLLISAHGASATTFEKALKLCYKIVDATCPMVKQIHKTAKTWEKKGYKIIIIGDKKHSEVQGIAGQLKRRPLIIQNIKSVPFKEIEKTKKAAIVVQSTRNLQDTLKIVDIIAEHVKELKFFNTICRPTQKKQKEIQTLPLENDIMIIIGSKASANTKRLYEISKMLNRKSFWIQSKKDIKPLWFKNVKNVGITAGASTPGSTIKEVIERIKKIKPQ